MFLIVTLCKREDGT